MKLETWNGVLHHNMQFPKLLFHNLLSNEQFSFREKRSTCSAIYTLLNTILLSLDKNKYAGAIFCDIHNAFDCVNNDILLAKLDYYGISGTANKLLRSYLKDRY